MKIHFVIPISLNDNMINQAKNLILSAKDLDAFFTILVHENDMNEKSKAFSNIAEVQFYKSDPDLANIWTASPRWSVQPKGDVMLGVDADMFVFNKDIVEYYACKSIEENAIYGTIAFDKPFPKEKWDTLFEKYSFSDEFKYKYGKAGVGSAPYYVNNGAVLVPASISLEYQFYFEKWLTILNKDHKYLFCLSQIVNTFAIKDGNFEAKEASKFFNYIENGLNPKDDPSLIGFFHYNVSKGKIKVSKNYLLSLFDKHKCKMFL